MPERSVLVTGGAGFIGSNIARHLGAAGCAVTICDAFGTSGKWRNLLSSDIVGIVAPDRLGDLLDRTHFDAVVHMGAISSTNERNVDLILRSNVDLSLLLWDYCVRRQSRLVYASSAATYGDGREGYGDEATSAALARLRPLNAYGWSKLLVDRIFVRRSEAGQPVPPQWAGLRFFNVFGPNEYHKADMRSVVCKIFEQIGEGRPASLFRSDRDDVPDGGQRRDFIYVDDCVRVVDWLLGAPAVSGLFNVGVGQARSWLDLANAVFAAVGTDPRIDYIDMPAALQGGYQYFTQADIGRLRRAGFEGRFASLEEGIHDYVTRYLAADQPYR